MKKILGVKRPLKLGVKRPGCETTGNPMMVLIFKHNNFYKK